MQFNAVIFTIGLIIVSALLMEIVGFVADKVILGKKKIRLLEEIKSGKKTLRQLTLADLE